MAVPVLTRVEGEDGDGGTEELVAEHLAEDGRRAAAGQRPLQRPQPEVAEVAMEGEGHQRYAPRLRPVGRLPAPPPPPQLLGRVARREEPAVEQHVTEPGEPAHAAAQQLPGHRPPPLPPASSSGTPAAALAISAALAAPQGYPARGAASAAPAAAREGRRPAACPVWGLPEAAPVSGGHAGDRWAPGLWFVGLFFKWLRVRAEGGGHCVLDFGLRCTIEALCSIVAAIKRQVKTRHCLLFTFLSTSLWLAYLSRLWLFLFKFAVVLQPGFCYPAEQGWCSLAEQQQQQPPVRFLCFALCSSGHLRRWTEVMYVYSRNSCTQVCTHRTIATKQIWSSRKWGYS